MLTNRVGQHIEDAVQVLFLDDVGRADLLVGHIFKSLDASSCRCNRSLQTLAPINMMKSSHLAFLISPLAPVVFWVLLTNDLQVLGQACLIAYAGMIFFALPLYRLVVKRWRISLSSSLICSCAVGFLTWVATVIIYNHLYTDDLFSPSLAALLGVFLFILFGSISGIAFWLLHPA